MRMHVKNRDHMPYLRLAYATIVEFDKSPH